MMRNQELTILCHMFSYCWSIIVVDVIVNSQWKRLEYIIENHDTILK